MLEYSDVITEIVPRSLAAYGRLFGATADETKQLEYDILRYYGLTFEEFIDARNAMLATHDGCLQQEDFHNTLLNRIIIDLVGREYLKLKYNTSPEDIKYVMTEKGITALLLHLSQVELPDEPYIALIMLRNLGHLKD